MNPENQICDGHHALEYDGNHIAREDIALSFWSMTIFGHHLFGEKERIKYATISGLMALAIFAVDLFLPRGTAIGLLYIIVVLLSLKSPLPQDTIYAALLGSVFSVIDYIFSAPAVPSYISLTNRSLYIAAIWAAAVICLKRKKSERERQALHKRLLEIESKEQAQATSWTLSKFLSNLLGLGILAQVVKTDNACDHSIPRSSVNNMLEHINIAMGYAKQLSDELHVSTTTTKDFMTDLQQFIAETTSKRGVKCQLHSQSAEVSLPSMSYLHLQRIIKAAFHHAIDFRQASEIKLDVEPTPRNLLIKVSDNGVDSSNNTPESIELLQMMGYRASLIGAHLELKKRHPAGVQLECAVPVGL